MTTSRMTTSCEIVTYRWCKECKKGFVDDKWCGELTCKRCLNLCWLVDDIDISNRIFSCCDYHRPQIASMFEVNNECISIIDVVECGNVCAKASEKAKHDVKNTMKTYFGKIMKR